MRFPQAPRPRASKPAPKWPDGQVRLGIGPGELGYWASPSAPSLVENTAGNLRMNREGILANLADSGKVAPFQPWAKGLYEYRQRNLLKDDPMASCLPAGGPRQFQIANGVEILEQPDRKRMFVMSGGGNRNWRLIYMDGRERSPSSKTRPPLTSETRWAAGKARRWWSTRSASMSASGFQTARVCLTPKRSIWTGTLFLGPTLTP